MKIYKLSTLLLLSGLAFSCNDSHDVISNKVNKETTSSLKTLVISGGLEDIESVSIDENGLRSIDLDGQTFPKIKIAELDRGDAYASVLSRIVFYLPGPGDDFVDAADVTDKDRNRYSWSIFEDGSRDYWHSTDNFTSLSRIVKNENGYKVNIGIANINGWSHKPFWRNTGDKDNWIFSMLRGPMLERSREGRDRFKFYYPYISYRRDSDRNLRIVNEHLDGEQNTEKIMNVSSDASVENITHFPIFKGWHKIQQVPVNTPDRKTGSQASDVTNESFKHGFIYDGSFRMWGALLCVRIKNETGYALDINVKAIRLKSSDLIFFGEYNVFDGINFPQVPTEGQMPKFKRIRDMVQGSVNDFTEDMNTEVPSADNVFEYYPVANGATTEGYQLANGQSSAGRFYIWGGIDEDRVSDLFSRAEIVYTIVNDPTTEYVSKAINFEPKNGRFENNKAYSITLPIRVK